jgi:hypothetical protein
MGGRQFLTELTEFGNEINEIPAEGIADGITELLSFDRINEIKMIF